MSLREIRVAMRAAGKAVLPCPDQGNMTMATAGRAHRAAGFTEFSVTPPRARSIRAAAIGCVCPQADRAFRFVVRPRAGRMRFQIAGARTAGRACPTRRRATAGGANSPAGPRAAHAATRARLRVQGIIRPQAGGSRSMGAAEARLRAAMLPGCGAGDAQAPGAAAGGEPVPDRTGCAFIAGRALTIRPAAESPFFRHTDCRFAAAASFLSLV